MQEQKTNEKEPLISIGLCVRNGERYLREALDSLLAQTHKNFELIISDNASTDGTKEISEEYAQKDLRIRYIRQKENIGSFANYDFVRQESRGDYFMYASNDDLWHPRFIEECLAKLKESTNAIVAFPNFCTFDDSGRVMKYDPQKYFPFARDPYLRLKKYLLSRSQYGKSTIIYGLWRKNVPADLILLNEYKSDMFYIFSMLSRGYFVAVPEILFFKRLPAQFQGVTLSPEQKPSLHTLISLPSNFPFESVDDWIAVRKKINKGRAWTSAWKEFITNRLQATKYYHLYFKCIWGSPALRFHQKIELSLWNCYAYLKGLWYGYL